MPLLGVMRHPAAPHCFTNSPSFVCTAPLASIKPHVHKHPYKCTRSPYPSLKCCLYLYFYFPPLPHALQVSSFFLFSFPLSWLPSSLCPHPILLPSLLSAGAMCNWAVVNSTLAWISSVVTSGWHSWPPLNKHKQLKTQTALGLANPKIVYVCV